MFNVISIGIRAGGYVSYADSVNGFNTPYHTYMDRVRYVIEGVLVGIRISAIVIYVGLVVTCQGVVYVVDRNIYN